MTEPPAASRPRTATLIVATAVLVALGGIVGVGLSEVAYRVYLFRTYPSMFRRVATEQPGTAFGVYNVSHWEFDEKFGYVYPPGRVIDQSKIEGGRATGCRRLNVINKHGNIGPIVGDYQQARLKILVFGDSWSAFNHDGRTWPLFLQHVLGERLGTAVNVVNFGRDGYGILQMFDLAAAKIAEWKPDLVIIAFISDDLSRARFWRTVVGEGGDVRVLTTLSAKRNPDLDTAADTYLLMPSATYEWCQRMRISGETDQVIQRLIEKRAALVKHNNAADYVPTADMFSVRESFLYNRLVHRDAFMSVRRWGSNRGNPSANPRVPYSSYADDPGFVHALDRIKTAGVPWVLFHLAYYPEIKEGQEYILEAQPRALLASLEALTGQPVLRTTDYVQMPVSAPERMNHTRDNFHPSLWGMEFYANAVANALIQRGLVRDGRRQ